MTPSYKILRCLAKIKVPMHKILKLRPQRIKFLVHKLEILDLYKVKINESRKAIFHEDIFLHESKKESTIANYLTNKEHNKSIRWVKHLNLILLLVLENEESSSSSSLLLENESRTLKKHY